MISLGGGEGDAGGLYAVPEEADVAGEAGVDPAQLVLRVAQSLVLGTRLLLPETITNPLSHVLAYASLCSVGFTW